MYRYKIINSFIKYVVTVYFFHVEVVECQFICTSPDICPPHKPYCTTSGCVFECPKSAYINGTECVAECGNHFVFDKTCVDHCPRNTILRETPKLLGKEIYIEKLCVTSCDRHEYIYNGTCVKACPPTHRYINENKCTTSCLQITPFISNVTVNGVLIHNCVKKCDYLIEDSFCTNVCVRNKYIFNFRCINQCPASHSFSYNQYCEQTCPDMTVIFGNNTCLSRCPIDYPYVFNNRCVNRCPKESAFVVSELNRLHCSTECPQMMFNNNLTCVEKCPNGTVIDNKMCRSQCSKHRPYSCIFQNNNPCSLDIHEVPPKQTICRELCPENMLTFDMTCMSNCPSGYKYLNATCVQICPDDFPFLYNKSVMEECDSYLCKTVTVRLTCAKSCPDTMYKMNQMCLPACPDGLFTVNKTCENVCPKMLDLKRHTHISYEKYDLVNNWNTYWRKQNIKVGIIECVTACRRDEWILNSTCIDTCPNNTFFANRTCLSKCPYTFNFIIQRTTVVKCSLTYRCEKLYRYWECLLECPPGTYQFNATCVHACPDFTFTFGNSCVNECPKGQRFLLQSKRTVSQWIQLGWNQKTWSEMNHTVNAGFICLKSCPPDKKIYNFTCKDQCPAKLFLNGNECVYECPPENPYGYKEYTPWTCIRYCKDKDSFFHDGSCTRYCPTPLIGYDGLCTDKCPDGLIWWYEECSRITVAVIWSASTFGIDIILLFLGVDILKEYFNCLHMAFRMKAHQTNEEVVKYTKKTGELQEYVNIEMVQITETD